MSAKIVKVNKSLPRHQSGIAHIIAILILGILFLAFLPIPSYRSKVICKTDSKCPQPGIYFQDSLFKQLLTSLTHNSSGATESSESWQTYTDDDFGYSFKYPASYTLAPAPTNDTYLKLTLFKEDETKNVIRIEIRDATLAEQVEYIKWTASHAAYNVYEEKDIEVAGFPAKRLDFQVDNEGQEPTTEVVVHNGKYAYSIRSLTSEIDQILSSFEFIN